MTPGQTHPRRRGLNELMESVAAKLAERPDHIAAARVLEEMQADAAKISHKADGVDVQNGQPKVSSSSSSSVFFLRFHPLFSMAGAIAVSALGIFCVIIAAVWEWRAGSVRKGKTG